MIPLSCPVSKDLGPRDNWPSLAYVLKEAWTASLEVINLLTNISEKYKMWTKKQVVSGTVWLYGLAISVLSQYWIFSLILISHLLRAWFCMADMAMHCASSHLPSYLQNLNFHFMPTKLLKEAPLLLSTSLTDMINLSLLTRYAPQSFKVAAIKLLLGKPSLDLGGLANYRPISNLPFFSKILEKTVANQLCDLTTVHMRF